jgi:hypothetical protein
VNGRPARSPGAPEGPALLVRLRDRLLDQVLGLLEADLAVAGVALVGSLGRREEDDWSDVDLFILASDQFIRQFMNEPAASPWARADLLSDGRHNSPAGATSLGATHIRSGLPLWVDLHVHPAAQIRALRDIAEDLTSPSWGQLDDAVASYLDLVEAAVRLGPAPAGSSGDNGSLCPRSASAGAWSGAVLRARRS